MKLYHNPRCSKSRQGLAILEEAKISFDIIKYLDSPLNKVELVELLALLDIPPIDLVRKNEAVWKASFKGKELSDSEIIDAMVAHPKLIERPIAVHNGKAIIGRPPELIKSLF